MTTGIVPYLNLGNLSSSCPRDEFRNGKKAIAYVGKACTLMKWQTRPFFVLATLAAGHADLGGI